MAATNVLGQTAGTPANTLIARAGPGPESQERRGGAGPSRTGPVARGLAELPPVEPKVVGLEVV